MYSIFETVGHVWVSVMFESVLHVTFEGVLHVTFESVNV